MSTLRATARAWLGCRCVDNLLTVHTARGNVHELPDDLWDLGFYQAPMRLEHEPALDFLGCMVEARGSRLTLDFNVRGFEEIMSQMDSGADEPTARGKWRYRSPIAAGSAHRALSGLIGKLRNAARFPFPVQRAKAAILKLIIVAIALGYTPKAMRTVVVGHAQKYKMVYTPQFVLRLTATLRSTSCIEQLREYLGEVQAEFYAMTSW